MKLYNKKIKKSTTVHLNYVLFFIISLNKQFTVSIFLVKINNNKDWFTIYKLIKIKKIDLQYIIRIYLLKTCYIKLWSSKWNLRVKKLIDIIKTIGSTLVLKLTCLLTTRFFTPSITNDDPLETSFENMLTVFVPPPVYWLGAEAILV